MPARTVRQAITRDITPADFSGEPYTITVHHGLEKKQCTVEFYLESNGVFEAMLPANVEALNSAETRLTFSQPVTGKLVIY